NRDGSLALDASRLDTALNEDFDSVAQLFYAHGSTTDSNLRYVSSNTSTREGSYRVLVDALASHGQLTGDALSVPLTIDASNDVISLVVDGVSSGTLTLTQGVYNDLGSLAQMLQGRINSASNLQNAGITVSVTASAGHLQISSDSYGEASSVSVALQNSSLGLTSNAVATPGSNVSGSIGPAPASGDGQLLTGSGSASGLVVEVTGSTTGNRGSVDYSKGIAGHLDSLLSRFLASDGQISSKTGSIQDQIEHINQQRVALDKRVAEIEDRYRRQFQALDVMLGQLQATGDYLQQQLDALPTVSISKK
ncbi:MAG TPA: flagellar filament capping protein FliD, partial [Pseudomonadales bacterium]